MRKLVMLCLALALGGCSTAVAGTTPGSSVTLPPLTEPSLTPEQATAAPVATLAPASIMPEAATPTAVATLAAPTTAAQVTSPTSILPTPALTGGWKTYTNALWHVALDYPADWSVRESAAAAVFVSPRGAMIQLAPETTGKGSGFEPNDDLPNTRCNSQITPREIPTRVCFDTLAFSTVAQFTVRPANGPESSLFLITNRRTGDLQVFAAMLASVRPLS